MIISLTYALSTHTQTVDFNWHLSTLKNVERIFWFFRKAINLCVRSKCMHSWARERG